MFSEDKHLSVYFPFVSVIAFSSDRFPALLCSRVTRARCTARVHQCTEPALNRVLISGHSLKAPRSIKWKKGTNFAELTPWRHNLWKQRCLPDAWKFDIIKHWGGNWVSFRCSKFFHWKHLAPQKSHPGVTNSVFAAVLTCCRATQKKK